MNHVNYGPPRCRNATRFAVLLFAGAALAFLVSHGESYSQKSKRDRRSDGQRMEELERLKQVRLIETLRLGEEEAVRLVSKQRAHREKQQEIGRLKNEALDGLSAALDSADTSNLSGAFKSVAAFDRRMFDERVRFDKEIKGLLTETQYARFLIFEREFQHDVKNAVHRMMKKRLR